MNTFEYFFYQAKMNKFENYTFVKGLRSLSSGKKAKLLTELKRRLEVLS